MVGGRIRKVRVSQRLSLQQVADKAEVSVATLSRIETEKQALDVTLLLSIAKILKVRAADLVDETPAGDEQQAIVQKFAQLDADTRRSVWKDLAARTRKQSTQRSRPHGPAELDELLAQLDFLRAEIEAVSRRRR